MQCYRTISVCVCVCARLLNRVTCAGWAPANGEYTVTNISIEGIPMYIKHTKIAKDIWKPLKLHR